MRLISFPAAPARVASFSQVLRRAVKSSVTLSCLVVGNPTPRPIWTYRNGQITTGRHYELTMDGHLNIRGECPLFSVPLSH